MQNVVAEFIIEQNQPVDTVFTINATPAKVSQLENDLNFQTADEVASSIQAESDIINSRIDSEVNALNGSISDVDGKIDNHISNTSNPHEVTKAQVGLGNADNTSDADKPVSTAQQTALDGKVDKLTTLPTAGTYTKVIINSQGQVTEGETLLESDIPSLHLTKISDVTATATELNILDGATVTTSELNVLDGITASTTELNYIDGVTSPIQTQFNNITDLIPSSATTLNQLADKDFVNSSVSTNTANFIGTFTSVSDLNAYSGTVTNNDYAFVINGVITNNGNDWATFVALDAYDKTLLTNFDYAWVINGSNFDLYRFDILNQEWDLRVQNTSKASVTLNNAYNRYKATVVSNVITWDFEYTLNNSSFTAEQWLAINSGITAVTKVTHTANTAIGSTTQPVYINANGEAVAITNTIAKSVPSNAVFTDTTYTIATGSANGTISVSVDGGTASDVAVKGLGSAAYTSSTDYATASQGSKADTAVQSVATGSTNGTISVDGTDVSVYGLGSAAYTSSTAYATSTQGGKADSAIQSVKVNGSALTPDANKAVDVPVPTNVSSFTNDSNYVSNQATGSNALSIGSSSSSNYATTLGDSTSTSGSGVVIGYSATSNKTAGIAIGREAEASTGNFSIALGYQAKAKGAYAIQIGTGTNSTANTLSVGFGTSLGNYELLDGSTGLIPDARISTNIARTSDLSNMQTTSNLVTSVSSASTDSQYPSAKLFYDTCGDIETLINAL